MFNSKECEWSDLSLFIDGVKITGFRGLKYSVKPDKESLYAGGDEPIGIQSGNRQYAGEIKLLKGQFDELNTAAKAAGYRDIYRQSLLTITEMEKLMGKPKFTEVLGGLVIKPPGKPTLVPLSDKRPPMNTSTAKTDFMEE